MKKYYYQVVDSRGKVVCGQIHNRKMAREVKKDCENYPLPGETIPYKILRYELTNPTVIR